MIRAKISRQAWRIKGMGLGSMEGSIFIYYRISKAVET